MPVPGPPLTDTLPTVDQIADRLSKDADAVQGAYDAEVADQASRCRVKPYTAALGEALVRRVARNLAMRNVPLGVQVDPVSGSTYIGSTDPEVRRLEGPYRRVMVG